MKKQYFMLACLLASCACGKNEPAPQKQDNRPSGGCCETPKVQTPQAPQSAQAPAATPAPTAQSAQAPVAPVAPQVTITTPEVKVEKAQ